MEAIRVNSTKKNVEITIDRNIIDENDVNLLLSRLNLEKLVAEANFDSDVTSLSSGIKENSWNKVKKEINFTKPN